MSEALKDLENELSGMAIYEYIVNNVDACEAELPQLTSLMKRADLNGQFLSSTARFLCAVDRDRFEPYLAPLIEGAIEKDRERHYIGSLLEAIWGENYMEEAPRLNREDDNFRRIYKRIFDTGM